jgi:hypothetical protein
MAKAVRTAALVVGAVALAATGIGAAGSAGLLGAGIAGGASIAGIGTAAALTSFGTIAGLAGTALTAVAAVTTKAPAAVAGGSQTEFTADPQAGVPYAIGRTGTAGNLIFRRAADGWSENTPNDLQDIVAVFSLGPIDAYESFTSDKVAISFDGAGNAIGEFKDKMFQRRQLGLTPEASVLTVPAGASASPSGWTSQHKLSGLAAAMWRLRYDSKQRFFQNGVPNPMWVARWVKTYDPRKDSTYPGGSGSHRWNDEATWEWSECPYLHALTWCIGRHQNGKRVAGLGAKIDRIIVSDFVEGANISDANGWKVGGVVYTRPDTKWNVLKQMLQAGAGKPTRVGARIGCMVNAPRVSLATIRNADIIGDASAAGTQRMRDRINTVTPRYRSEAHDWEIVPGKPIAVAEHIAEDGDERSREITYHLCQSADQAATLARYDIEESREFGPIKIPLKPAWLNYKAGDCLTLETDEIAAEKVLLLRRSIDPATGSPTFEMQSETDGKHPFALGQVGYPPPTASIDPVDQQAPAPAADEWTVSAIPPDVNGVSRPGLALLGSVRNGNADAILVEYRIFDAAGLPEAGWTGATLHAPDMARTEIYGLEPETPYEVGVRYRVRRVLGERRVYGPVTTGPDSLADDVADLEQQVQNVYANVGDLGKTAEEAIASGKLTEAQRVGVGSLTGKYADRAQALISRARALGIDYAEMAAAELALLNFSLSWEVDPDNADLVIVDPAFWTSLKAAFEAAFTALTESVETGTSVGANVVKPGQTTTEGNVTQPSAGVYRMAGLAPVLQINGGRNIKVGGAKHLVLTLDRTMSSNAVGSGGMLFTFRDANDNDLPGGAATAYLSVVTVQGKGGEFKQSVQVPDGTDSVLARLTGSFSAGYMDVKTASIRITGASEPVVSAPSDLVPIAGDHLFSNPQLRVPASNGKHPALLKSLILTGAGAPKAGSLNTGMVWLYTQEVFNGAPQSLPQGVTGDGTMIAHASSAGWTPGDEALVTIEPAISVQRSDTITIAIYGTVGKVRIAARRDPVPAGMTTISPYSLRDGETVASDYDMELTAVETDFQGLTIYEFRQFDTPFAEVASAISIVFERVGVKDGFTLMTTVAQGVPEIIQGYGGIRWCLVKRGSASSLRALDPDNHSLLKGLTRPEIGSETLNSPPSYYANKSDALDPDAGGIRLFEKKNADAIGLPSALGVVTVETKAFYRTAVGPSTWDVVQTVDVGTTIYARKGVFTFGTDVWQGWDDSFTSGNLPATTQVTDEAGNPLSDAEVITSQGTANNTANVGTKTAEEVVLLASNSAPNLLVEGILPATRYRITNNRVERIGDLGVWRGSVFSVEEFTGGVKIAGRLAQGTFIGLTVDYAQGATNDYTKITFGAHRTSNAGNAASVWVNGAVHDDTLPSFTDNQDVLFAIAYDEVWTRFVAFDPSTGAGVVLAEIRTSSNLKLRGVVMGLNPGSIVRDLSIEAIASKASADSIMVPKRGFQQLSNGSSVTKPAGAVGGWGNFTASEQGITGPCQMSFTMRGGHAMAGLSPTPGGYAADPAAQYGAFPLCVYREYGANRTAVHKWPEGVVAWWDGILPDSTEFRVVNDESSLSVFAGTDEQPKYVLPIEAGRTWYAAATIADPATSIERIRFDTQGDVTYRSILTPADLPELWVPTRYSGAQLIASIDASNPMRFQAQLFLGPDSKTLEADYQIAFTSGVTASVNNTPGSPARGEVLVTACSNPGGYIVLRISFQGKVVNQVIPLKWLQAPSITDYFIPNLPVTYASGSSTTFVPVGPPFEVPWQGAAYRHWIYARATIGAAVTSDVDNSVTPYMLLQRLDGAVWNDVGLLSPLGGAAKDYLFAGLRYKDVAVMGVNDLTVMPKGHPSSTSLIGQYGYQAFRWLAATPDADTPLEAPQIYMREFFAA